MFECDSFYSVLAPMYYIAKPFGLTPFRIDSNGFKKSRISLWWSLMFLTFLHIYTIITHNNMPVDDSGFIDNVTSMLDTYSSQAGIFCGIFCQCFYLKSILHAINGINCFDKFAQINFQIDLRKKYKREKTYLILGLFITVTLATLSITFTAVGAIDGITGDVYGEFIYFTAPQMLNIFVDLQFCVILLCLMQRFNWLNQKMALISSKLQKSLEENDGLFVINLKNSARPATHVVVNGLIQDKALSMIEMIRRKHFHLCTISKLLNNAYSIQLLVILLQNFVTITAALYYAGIHLVVDKVIPVEYVIYTLVQLSLALVQVVALIIVCSNTVQEAEKMGVIIHNVKLLNGKVKNKLKEELQLEIAFFSLQLFHHNVKFAPCNVFEINEALLPTIIGAITTYLIIVIQFDIAEARG